MIYKIILIVYIIHNKFPLALAIPKLKLRDRQTDKAQTQRRNNAPLQSKQSKAQKNIRKV